jgi:NhaP-type Na+/H+ or K+/H+ antiporter
VSHELLIGLTAVIVLGIGAQWLAWRIRLPAILLLLLIGFVAGPIARYFNLGNALLDPGQLSGDVLRPFISIAVAVILFEGGLTLRFSEIVAVGHVVRNLVTIGALVTWLLSALAAHLLTGLSVPVAVLLGGILVVTGPTVIGPMLRYVRPTGPVGPILNWEGIVTDPIGAMLAVLVFEFILASDAGQARAEAAFTVGRTILAGGGIGVALGALMTFLLARHWVPDYLHNPVSLMLIVFALTASDAIQQESGLFTVTVMGMVLANQRIADTRHILEFKENLRVLLIGALFIILAARIEPQHLEAVDWPVAAFVLALIVVVRPLAVLVSTIGSELRRADRFFLASMAPRGIVAAAIASIFALQLESAGVEDGGRLVPLAFAVIIVTVAVYGLAAAPLARRLRLAVPDPQGVLFVGANPISRAMAKALHDKGVHVLLADRNRSNTSAARMQGLPAYSGDMLLDRALEEIHFGGLGRLLAMTPNDGVNALAAEHFEHEFGRSNVYQLPRAGAEKEPLPRHLGGRRLFHKSAEYWELQRRLNAGQVVKATRLTDQFDYGAFRATYGEEALPLFWISEGGRLNVITADAEFAPRAGQTLIALVREPGEPHTAKDRRGGERSEPEGEGTKPKT